MTSSIVDVTQLPLGFAELGPFELRQDGVFGRCDEDVHAKDDGGDAASHFFPAERTGLSKDHVDLPCRRSVDDVELASAPEFITGNVSVEVDIVALQAVEQTVQRIERRIYDDVDVLRRARRSVMGARERAREHVRDAGLIERRCNPAQEARCVTHGIGTGGPGHSLLAASLP